MAVTMSRDDLALIEGCRQSPNLFASFVMGFEQGDIHKQMQRFMTNHDNLYLEVSRGHGKTAQMCLRVAWEVGRDPTVRIKYVQQSDVEAKKTTGLIKSIIEGDAFKAVFPEIEPDMDNWCKADFKVKQKTWQRDATVEAKPIFGRAGGRADILIADDICDLRNAIQQAALRDQVKEFWNTNWLPMRDFSKEKHPRTWKVGTCYHADDITADWRKMHEEIGGLLRLPVIDFVSPWSEVVTTEALKNIRKEIGPFAFARSYELKPVTSDLIIFDPEWIRDAIYTEIPEWEGANGITVAALDFAFTEKKIGGDPDYSVCIIAWKDRKGGLWLKDIIRQRSSFPDFARKASKAMIAAGVDQAVAEANGPQLGLVQQLQKDCPNVPIRPLNRDRDKITRASERQGYVESGQLHLPAQDGTIRSDFRVVFDEMTTFPVGGHDDTVDAVIDLIELTANMGAPLEAARIGNTKKNPRDIYGIKSKKW
tara:strand:+ start:2720 stop:4159 length:1440 start_codon:yes stop_codon:yes gene_type:complete